MASGHTPAFASPWAHTNLRHPPTTVLCIWRWNKMPTKQLREWRSLFWLMASQSTATWHCVIVANTVTRECGQGNHSLSYEYEARTRIQEGISQGHTPGIYFFQRFPPSYLLPPPKNFSLSWILEWSTHSVRQSPQDLIISGNFTTDTAKSVSNHLENMNESSQQSDDLRAKPSWSLQSG